MKHLIFILFFFLISCAEGSSAPQNNTNNHTNNYNNISGDFGIICTTSTNCSSGYRIDFPDGNQKCTITCSTQNCPDGFSCRPFDKTPNAQTLCLPYPVNICASCTNIY